MASSNKKVLVVRFDRETLAGFLQMPGGLEGDAVELLRPQGNLIRVPLAETKLVCFVRDFEGGETWRDHRAFSTRPKMAGIWVRFAFRDGDWLEGVAPNDLLRFDPGGFQAVPPDPTYHNQRVFVPRTAVSSVQVLGVIGSPLRRRVKEPAKAGQLRMFE
ncbi:MAG TPA: hypothetical protein VIY49_16360 [Bryobacteraceae bacterium]